VAWLPAFQPIDFAPAGWDCLPQFVDDYGSSGCDHGFFCKLDYDPRRRRYGIPARARTGLLDLDAVGVGTPASDRGLRRPRRPRQKGRLMFSIGAAGVLDETTRRTLEADPTGGAGRTTRARRAVFSRVIRDAGGNSRNTCIRWGRGQNVPVFAGSGWGTLYAIHRTMNPPGLISARSAERAGPRVRVPSGRGKKKQTQGPRNEILGCGVGNNSRGATDDGRS